MLNFAKLAIAAAAVVAVAVVGINLMAPGGGQVGGPAATPTPSPKPSPTPDRTAGSAADGESTAAGLFPTDGPISAGTHTAILEGIPVSSTVPAAGWTVSPGNFIGTESYGQSNRCLLQLVA